MSHDNPAIEDHHDFTEAGYLALLRLACSGWRFISYSQASDAGRVCIWRHDVDVSMHRALALARIEARENVVTTYFLYPHCSFYNLFETYVTRIVQEIASLGHHIGLHFDPVHYGFDPKEKKRWKEALSFERKLIERSVGAPVQAFSLHNPDLTWLQAMTGYEQAGMINAYHPDFIGGKFRYVSDSNGYWRHACLAEVLREGVDERIHALTHPEWWTPEFMPPRARIERAAWGRARRVLEEYDAFLEKNNRSNIR